MTGLSHKAEKLLTMAVEMWPTIQKPFAKDPITEVVENQGAGGEKVDDMIENVGKL